MEDFRINPGFLSTYDFSKAVRSGPKLGPIVCQKHGEFSQYLKYLRSGRAACPQCGRERGYKRQALTTEVFVSRCREIHGDRYDYSLVDYKTAYDPVRVICPDHGEFSIQPISHLYAGARCMKCAVAGRGAARRANSGKSYVSALIAVHGDTYDYSKFVYTGSLGKAEIICRTHGSFWMAAGNHLAGQGCPECKGAKISAMKMKPQEQFLSECRQVHGDQYDYSQVQYQGAKEEITIICRKHGEFRQTALNHLYGQKGCPSCGQKSRGEDEIAGFMEGLGLQIVRRDRQLIAPKEIDILVPSLKLAIEYCGLYWHSEENGYRQGTHLAKHKAVEAAGYRLITIFEDEWLEQRSKVEATLRHFSGQSSHGVFGRLTEVREIDLSVARSFLDKHHLLGRGSTAKTAIGAFYGSDLLGVMTFGTPSDERGATGEIEMKRYVCDGRNHPGLGSKMFRWAITQYKWDRVIAFVDRRWFGGNFKLHAGFHQVGESLPSLFWTNRQKRFHRRAFKKSELAARHGAGLSKPEMMKRDGYSRIWDCGKLKFEWTANKSVGLTLD